MSEKNDTFEIMEFSPEVEQFEDELINFLINSPLFSSKSPFFVKIFGYFITRKTLTQDILKKLTNFSKGKISQEINKLFDMELIEKAKTSSKGEITYISRSVGLTFLKLTKNIIEHMLKWEDEIFEIKSELDDKKKQLKKMMGYEEIYQTTNFLLPLIQDYKKLLSYVDNAIKEFEN